MDSRMGCIGLGAILLIFGGLLFFFIHAPVGLNDESLYAWNIKLNQENPDFIFSTDLPHPAIPNILAAKIFPAIDPLIVGRMLSLFWGIVSIILIYLLGRAWFGTEIGLIAAALFAFNPAFMSYSNYGLLDTGVVTATAIAVYGLQLKSLKGKGIFIFGIVLGAALKSHGWVLPLLIGMGWFFSRHLYEKQRVEIGKKKITQRMKKWTLFFMGLTVVIIGASFPVAQLSTLVESAMNALTLFPFFLLPFAIVGWWHAGRYHSFTGYWALISLSIIFFLSHAPDSIRFLLPVSIPLSLLAAKGLNQALHSRNYFGLTMKKVVLVGLI
ncbi:MAG: glycosyltransferase family 39 protein, partial [archaeon]